MKKEDKDAVEYVSAKLMHGLNIAADKYGRLYVVAHDGLARLILVDVPNSGNYGFLVISKWEGTIKEEA